MSGKDKGVGEDYIFLMSIEEIKKLIHDHLEEQQISMINLSRRLDFTSNTIANFMLGKGMSVRFYRSLERYLGIDILKKIESTPAHLPERSKKENFDFLIEPKELRGQINRQIKISGKSRSEVLAELGYSKNSNVLRKFLEGQSMSKSFYRRLEEVFDLEIIKEDEEEKEEAAEKEEKPKKKTFLKPWMIQNLKNYGNTFVCNLSKRRSAKAVQEEFAKFGINVLVKENGVATLLREGK